MYNERFAFWFGYLAKIYTKISLVMRLLKSQSAGGSAFIPPGCYLIALNVSVTKFSQHAILTSVPKPNILLYLPYYADACNEFAVTISAS